ADAAFWRKRAKGCWTIPSYGRCATSDVSRVEFTNCFKDLCLRAYGQRVNMLNLIEGQFLNFGGILHNYLSENFFIRREKMRWREVRCGGIIET
ncbi:MAG: hypothetical protein ACAH83_12800, partial [Alphaproteobacteria bacterium]